MTVSISFLLDPSSEYKYYDVKNMVGKGGKWTDLDVRRKSCMSVAIIVVTIIILALVCLPVVIYDTRQIWTWGWIDTINMHWHGWYDFPSSGVYMTDDGFIVDYFYPIVMFTEISSLIQALAFVIVLAAMIFGMKQDAVKCMVSAATIAWIWATCLVLTPSSSERPCMWIALSGATVLTIMSTIASPTAFERDDLEKAFAQIKQNVVMQFKRGVLKPVLDAVIDHAALADELGAWNIARGAREFRSILPKLWHTYATLSKPGQVKLKDFQKTLELGDQDFSKYLLDLASILGLEINGEWLLLRGALNERQLVETAESLLLKWFRSVDSGDMTSPVSSMIMALS